MKTAVLAFFGLVVAALAHPATVNVTSAEGATAIGEGEVTSAAAADSSSGVASGALHDDGAVLGMATVGSAIAGAISSPSL